MSKKLRSLFIAFLMTFVLVKTVFAADFSNFVILHTDDSHGYDEYNETNGNMGMAAIAQIKKDLETQGKVVLLMDAGDYLQGSTGSDFSKGAAVIGYMNAAGYDVATVGNHEFSYGKEKLLSDAALASFPIVSSNIIQKSTGTALFAPSVILDKGGKKIGIIGVTTPETSTAATPAYVAGLDFAAKEQMYSLVQREVNSLKNQNVDLVIALAHLGNEEILAGSTSIDLAKHVTGLDIIIDGHDHVQYAAYVNGTLLAEAGEHTTFLGMTQYENGKWVESFIPFRIGIPQEAAVKALIDAETARINAVLGRVIGKSKFVLSNESRGFKETVIGNFVTDSFLWKAKQVLGNGLKMEDTLSIANAGGLRDSLPAGDITCRNARDVMPFGNELYCVQVTGRTILEALEAGYQSADVAEKFNGFPEVGNAEIIVNTRVPYVKGEQYPGSLYNAPAAPGARVTIKSIGGKPFDLNKVYNLIVADFVMTGGDTYGALARPGAILKAIPLSCTDTDTLVDFIEQGLGGVIPEEYASPQGRTKIGSYAPVLPNAKSLAETRAAGMAVLNTATDMVIGQGFRAAAAAAAAEEAAANEGKKGDSPAASAGFTPYAAAGGSNMRYNTGSHVDSKGWNANIGFARTINYQGSRLTLVPFVEYGKSGYDSYLDNGTHGNGDNTFTGIGIMAKNELKNGLYYEGSLRAGRMKSDYEGDIFLGRYDTASNYLALHAGIGRAVKVTKDDSLDYYGKLFWTHQNGDSVMVTRDFIGDSYRYDFEAINSYRLRLGARWTRKLGGRDAFYAGLAWDYEFDSEARAHYEGGSSPAPGMKGSSGMLELGWRQETTKANPFGMDFSVNGWCGKQRGITFNAGFKWCF